MFGRRLKVTNLDKVLFPGRDDEPPVTKREFIRYAARIAPVVLPYLKDRPLNMHRFPGGAGAKGFWHKQLPEHAPDWLPRWDNPDADPGESTTYLVVNEPAALVWAANFGALEWHAWTSRTDRPDLPTYALIDIDAGSSTSWEDVLVLARLHRTALDHLGVRAQPKVTGHTGVQIWIPIERGPSFEDTRKWVEQLSKAVGAVVPDLVSWQWDVHKRGGLARLDYTQNVKNKTLVAPYSPRPAPGAPVSVPIESAELDNPSLRPDGSAVRTVLDRLAERGDPFRSVLGPGRSPPGDPLTGQSRRVPAGNPLTGLYVACGPHQPTTAFAASAVRRSVFSTHNYRVRVMHMSSIRLFILGTLAASGPLHGHQFRQQAQADRTGGMHRHPGRLVLRCAQADGGRGLGPRGPGPSRSVTGRTNMRMTPEGRQYAIQQSATGPPESVFRTTHSTWPSNRPGTWPRRTLPRSWRTGWPRCAPRSFPCVTRRSAPTRTWTRPSGCSPATSSSGQRPRCGGTRSF